MERSALRRFEAAAATKGFAGLEDGAGSGRFIAEEGTRKDR